MQKGKVIPALHFLAAASSHMAHPAPSLEKPAKAREPSELRPRSAQFKRNTPDSKVAAETAASTPPQGQDAEPARPRPGMGPSTSSLHLSHHRAMNEPPCPVGGVAGGTTHDSSSKVPGVCDRRVGLAGARSSGIPASAPSLARGVGAHLGVMRPLPAPSRYRPGEGWLAGAGKGAGQPAGGRPRRGGTPHGAAGGGRRRKWALRGGRAISSASRRRPRSGKRLPIYK